MDTYEKDPTIKMAFAITLSNLNYLSIHICHVELDEFERFIKNLNSKLKVLRVINQYENMTFLDDYRWKKLILQYLPQLGKISFQHVEGINDEDRYPVYSRRLNPLSASFWIKKQ